LTIFAKKGKKCQKLAILAKKGKKGQKWSFLAKKRPKNVPSVLAQFHRPKWLFLAQKRAKMAKNGQNRPFTDVEASKWACRPKVHQPVAFSTGPNCKNTVNRHDFAFFGFEHPEGPKFP